jgi:hypothetical protein
MSTITACPYLAGVASVDVTPPVGSKLAGFAARTENSTGVYLPLRAIVTALTDRATDQTVIIVSLEWLGFCDTADKLRALIQAATGVPPDHIVLCATHTHYGPAVGKGGVLADCLADIDVPFIAAAVAGMAGAAATAMANRRPVTLSSSLGWCGMAHSRRRPDGKGGVEWKPTLEAPHDHTVPMLRCADENGKLVHVLFSYAAHPTSGGPHLLQIGGDYPGFAVQELEQQLGCTAAFLLGCAGDQKPFKPDPAQDGFPQCPLPEIQAFGRQLAEAVIREIQHGPWRQVAGPLTALVRKVELHTTVLARAVYAAWIGSDNVYFDRWARDHVAILDQGQRPETAVAFELHTVQFGRSLVLVGMAGEMTAEYGLRVVRELGRDFGQAWPVGYISEMAGYLPAERQLPEGGYEVLGHIQYTGKSGPYESGTEEKIFAPIREMLVVG